jgi:hypothetical protein
VLTPKLGEVAAAKGKGEYTPLAERDDVEERRLRKAPARYHLPERQPM